MGGDVVLGRTLASLLADIERKREATLAAMRRLGPADARTIATALGMTSPVERNRRRSRLVGYERQGHVYGMRREGGGHGVLWRAAG